MKVQASLDGRGRNELTERASSHRTSTTTDSRTDAYPPISGNMGVCERFIYPPICAVMGGCESKVSSRVVAGLGCPERVPILGSRRT